MIFLVVFLDVKIDAAIAFVGKTVVHDLLHQFFLLDDMSCGMWLDAWRQHVQSLHGLMVAVGIILRNLHGLKLFQSSFLGNFVLALIGIMFKMPHISNVSHIAHLVAQMLEITEKNVKGDGRTGVSQMGVAIYGWSTHIHAYIRRMNRLKRLFPTRQRIINDQFLFHCIVLYCCKDSAKNRLSEENEKIVFIFEREIFIHERSKDVLVIVCFCSPFDVFMGFCFSRPAWPFCTQAQMS